ncbi:right-handed parallel beta-helix repeat-containing protein [Microbacterium deminutum]
MTSVIHVATSGSDLSDGTADRPYRTIDHAAQRAMPGDTVRVHDGTYREWVRPARGGRGEQRRITFEAAPGEHVAIKGSEVVTGWELVSGTVWRAAVPNSLFGDFNPFAAEIDGDWIVYADLHTPKKHLGDVYLNGLSFYESETLQDVFSPSRTITTTDDWTGSADHVRNPDQTLHVWFAEVGATETTITANFQAWDPNMQLVEINVRRSVFFPTEHHIDYITVRGFELAHAATPWAPPTADQPGLIGPNWAKGWIIEDNIIHDARCSAISLGKEASTGHNFAADRRDKPGYQYQLESVFSARQIGWDEEHVGSHIIRRNTIFDCGQTGIVGHLGCVFSTIEDNHIYNIAIKREFYGYEIAGIKLHAAIDVEIVHNRIHDCSLAIWLDWQTQGTRIGRNLLYANSRDLFVEVSHGPYLVEHNIFGSRASLEVFSQGGAFVNNLVCGTLSVEPVVDRPTPYHRPHSTQVAGYAAIYAGDDRFIGNVFLSGDADAAYGATKRRSQSAGYGTAAYDGHPATLSEYLDLVADPTKGDHERFADVNQPVYIRQNVYAPGAAAYRNEDGAVLLTEHAAARLAEDGEAVYLETDLPSAFNEASLGVTCGTDLPPVRFVDAHFENRDGTPVTLNVDLTGARKNANQRYSAGPVSQLPSGASRTRVW